MADQIVVMQAGGIEQMGAPLELFDQAGQHLRRRLHPARRAMNMLKGKVEAGVRCASMVGRPRPPVAGSRRSPTARMRSTASAPSISRSPTTVCRRASSVVEPTGSETHRRTALRRERDRRAVSRASRCKPGDTLGSRGRAKELVHLFDPQTGQAASTCHTIMPGRDEFGGKICSRVSTRFYVPTCPSAARHGAWRRPDHRRHQLRPIGRRQTRSASCSGSTTRPPPEAAAAYSRVHTARPPSSTTRRPAWRSSASRRKSRRVQTEVQKVIDKAEGKSWPMISHRALRLLRARQEGLLRDPDRRAPLLWLLRLPQGRHPAGRGVSPHAVLADRHPRRVRRGYGLPGWRARRRAWARRSSARLRRWGPAARARTRRSPAGQAWRRRHLHHPARPRSFRRHGERATWKEAGVKTRRHRDAGELHRCCLHLRGGDHRQQRDHRLPRARPR